jgi:8-hydroxy-5-deazaflavin:NADPH oxidoreductase
VKIGIIGSGNIGGRLGVHWANAGHEVMFSSRHPEKLSHLGSATHSKARTGTTAEAVASSEVILLAVPYAALGDALAAAGPLEGKIVIDATNPYTSKGLAVPDTTTGYAELRKNIPSARVVKAFNAMMAKILSEQSHREPPWVVFISGDDAGAKEAVARLAKDAGFDPYDLGDGSRVHLQEPRGSLFNKTFTRAEADAFLSGIR